MTLGDVTVLNGPVSAPVSLAVSTTAIELKSGASRLEERRVISVQPLDGDIYYAYRDEGETVALPTTGTGTLIRKGQITFLEASDSLGVWAIAASAVDVRIQEIG